MSNQTLILSNLVKKIWLLGAALIISIGVLSGVFRSLTPWAKEYKSEIEQHLSSLVGQPVTIQTMETGWYWFQPLLKLNQVTLGSNAQQNFHVDKLLVGINLFKSLWKWQIQPGVLFIDEVHLNFREKDKHWALDGINTDVKSPDMTPEKSKQILVWLSQQEHLVMKHVSAFFYFNDGALIPIDGLNVSIANSRGHYKFKGEARIAQTRQTDFKLFGEGYFNPERFDDIEGQFYFSAKNIIPAQWQNFFPKTVEQIEGGKGDVALWADVHHGALSFIQAQVHLQNLVWRLLNTQDTQRVQSFFANLSWKPDSQGWQLHGDQIKLRIGEVDWPENQLLVKYNKPQESYQLFIKSIIIESLFVNASNWPQEMQTLLCMKPQGILSNTQVLLHAKNHDSSIPSIPLFNTSNVATLEEMPPAPNTEEEPEDKSPLKNEEEPRSLVSGPLPRNGFSLGPYTVNYVLTRFEQVGWEAKDNIPQIKNLSGVIHWQPEEGRLELDSEHLLIKAKDYPAQTITLLDSSLDWSELSDGLRISVDRFVLNQPELTLSMQGAIDQVSRQSAGAVRLNAEFSGQNLQKWMSFLPQKYMKPKLYLWLTQDLKRIEKGSGTVKLNGLLNDFPFDKHNGEFSIESYVTGGELAINSKWQEVNDIDAHIHFKNRDLNIDLVHANFQGAEASQINLRIDEIGKNKENMVITGKIDAPVQKMVNYVLASPLKEKLTLLNMLFVEDAALLNLNIEVPLYPENDDILVKGSLVLENNTIKVKHELGEFPVKNTTGEILFNEEGVADSILSANILEHPMSIKIHSAKEPHSALSIAVNGRCTVDSLKNQLKLPLLDLSEGSFDVNAVLKLAHNPSDPDSITLTSSLEGLAIKLPEPLGKASEIEAPLTLSLDINPKKTMRFKGNYDERISADFLLKKSDAGYSFDSGQLRLGAGHALSSNLSGLSVVGALKKFNMDQWNEVANRFASGSPNTLLSKLRAIHVTIEQLPFLKQQFDTLTLKAKKVAAQEWAFSLKQKNIAADLVYNIPKQTLSGHADYLHLDKLDVLKKGSSESSLLHPNQIPNLDVRIDDFSVGKIKIGELAVKSKSSTDKWTLSSCQISSPFYQLNAEGEWLQQGDMNQTKMDVILNIKDLTKAQELWDIKPVVYAKKGYMEFHGGWKKSLDQFSFAALNGETKLQLRNGRVTHLSKGTEEKLGLGKLLSILSLQTLPRRLQLDFSDLAHTGYSFDVFQGNFEVKKGMMSTEDSFVDGPVAYASMKGGLDLVKRSYDLNLQISPHITASLPVVATIAGGPVAGVAVWVANSIINQGIQKISAYGYKITGPWEKPVVQQLNIVKKKEHQNSVTRH